MSAVAAIPTSLQPSPVPTATAYPAVCLTDYPPGAAPTALVQTFPSATPGGSTVTPTITSQAPPPPAITPVPTATRPSPTGTVVGTGVQIVSIFYDGVKGESEPDEYIEIKNFETTPVDMSFWLIHAVTNDFYYVFSDFTIQPGQSCRVYTRKSTRIHAWKKRVFSHC